MNNLFPSEDCFLLVLSVELMMAVILFRKQTFMSVGQSVRWFVGSLVKRDVVQPAVEWFYVE